MGDGSRTRRLTPVEVTGLSNVKAIAAGNSFSAALKNDGSVWEWGVVLPFDTPRGMPRVVPVQTTGLSDVVSLYGGEVSFGLIAIHADGQSWSRWITGTPPVRQVAEGALAGASAGYGLTLLQRVDGSVLSYGFSGNGFGSLGDGTTNYRDVRGPVVDIGNIVDVAAGTWHGSCAGYLRASLELDTSGQLGRGRILEQLVPAVVPGLPRLVQVSAATAHNLAIDELGSIWSWGSNGYGQLGDASYSDRAAAVKLTALSDVTSVLVGTYFSLAVQRDGSVWFWGGNLPGVAT